MAEVDVVQRARAHVRKAADQIVTLTGQGGGHRPDTISVVDYRLPEITNNGARAMGPAPSHKVDRNFRAPWHYHECDLQIGVITSGSVEYSYGNGEYRRGIASDLLIIPGLGPHDVLDTSIDYSGVEITFPGTFSTIETDEPSPDTNTPWDTLSWSDAVRTGSERGIAIYTHTLPERFRAKYEIIRERRSLTVPFEPATVSNDDPYRLLFLTKGSRDVVVDGEPSHLVEQDMLVVSAGARWEDRGASDDYEAVWIVLH